MSATIARPIAEPTQPVPPASRLGILLLLLRPYRWLLTLTVLVGVAMHGGAIASASLGAYLVGRAVTGASAAELVPLLWPLGALVAPLAALPWAETVLAHIVAFRVLADLRVQIYDAFERLAPAYLLERRSGDLGTTAMGDVELLEIGLSHTLPPLVEAVVLAAGALIALALFHWSLALLLFPFVVAVIAVPMWLGRRDDAEGRTVRDKVGAVGAEVLDAVQGLREVLVFGAQRATLDLLARRERTLYDAQLAHGHLKGLQLGANELITGLGVVATVALAAVLVANGVLAAALLPACVALAGATFVPLTVLMAAGREAPLVLSAVDRIYTILSTPASVTDLVSTAPAAAVTPLVRFEDVRFRYGPQLPEALSGVSFTIQPGETVALVGHSGAGKSTCAHLLLRLWDVSGGRITIGGHDLRAFPQHDLRALIATVPQDVYLFNRPVQENIRLGRTEASDAAVAEAAERAQASGFIQALPERWATLLGERGARLSGGQRQRIAVARALLKDAPILVLDEAVSSLDVESEQALQAALGAARAGRTTLVIAHRLSTIRAADRIVVLERGRVVEQGTFDALITANGTFTRLTASGAVAPIDGLESASQQ